MILLLSALAVSVGKKKKKECSDLMMNVLWNMQMYVERGGRGHSRIQGHAPCSGAILFAPRHCFCK